MLQLSLYVPTVYLSSLWGFIRYEYKQISRLSQTWTNYIASNQDVRLKGLQLTESTSVLVGDSVTASSELPKFIL